MQKAYLIFEPRSGKCEKEQDLRLVQQTLLPEVDLEISLTSPAVTAQELAQQAVERDFDLVLVLGGDGTVSAVVEYLLNTDIPLGIIPRGTANAFAHRLGIPLDIKAACELILKGETRYIDAVRTNYRTMISTIGIGFEANAFEIVEQQEKKSLGLVAYGKANLEALQDLPYFEVELETDEEVLRLQGVAVTVANAAPVFSWLAHGVGETVVDDGLLDFTIVNPQGMLDVATAGFSLVKAALREEASDHDQVLVARLPSFKVTTYPPQNVLIDGELVGKTPVEVTCLAHSLKLIAPPD